MELFPCCAAVTPSELAFMLGVCVCVLKWPCCSGPLYLIRAFLHFKCSETLWESWEDVKCDRRRDLCVRRWKINDSVFGLLTQDLDVFPFHLISSPFSSPCWQRLLYLYFFYHTQSFSVMPIWVVRPFISCLHLWGTGCRWQQPLSTKAVREKIKWVTLPASDYHGRSHRKDSPDQGMTKCMMVCYQDYFFFQSKPISRTFGF